MPRSRSFRGSTGSSIPTPKSKPSSRKYPAQRTPIRQNQKISRPMSAPSVQDGGRRGAGGRPETAALPGERRVHARIAPHQDEVDDPEREVQQREDGEARPDPRGAGGRGK